MRDRDPALFGLVLGSGALLNQVSRALNTAAERVLAPLGLTAQQAALLLHAAEQARSPSQLTELLGTDTAGVTRLLDRLQDKGLLRRTRHSRDRRSIVIELTPHGRSIVPTLPPVFGRISTQAFAGFTTTEITEMTAMLHRVLDNLTR